MFLFPASAREVRLKSNTFIPALLGGRDPRPLGVSLTGLVFLERAVANLNRLGIPESALF